ncbi:MAG TPA: VOC family protein [Gemmatimonadales bacterium]|nr:VOC family protein [Gemmatimonadales bacterium]
MIELLALHHVSLPVTDLARSRRFYREVLGLEEMPRPPFDFPGAWYRVGSGQLHLIVHDRPTLRARGVDSHDVHFAIRVRGYRDTLAALRVHGYTSDATDELLRIREQPAGRAGFPQIFLLDPDRHVIELNAESLAAS